MSVPRIDVAGRSVVLHYTDAASEYTALRNGAAVVDRSHRHRLSMYGKATAEALNGLVTNDVVHLEAGRGQYAAALSPKGKIVADMRIFHRADGSFVADTSTRAAAGWMEIVRKYINPRSVKYRDDTDGTGVLGVFGPRAAEHVALALSLDRMLLSSLEPYSLLETEWTGWPAMIVASPGAGVSGFDLFVAQESIPELKRTLAELGAEPAGLTAWEIARIETGTPEWGIDMDENTLVQEANLDRLHAVSFTKGCYTGQEVVARIHFRGHVNQHLRQLKFVSETLPPRGAKLLGEEGREVGEVRSSAHSPRTGGVAIAMVRRETPAGASVSVRWDGGECQAGVYETPTDPAA